MSNNSGVGFIAALFDFQLRHYITLRVLRVLYAISAIIILLFGVFGILYSLFVTMQEDPTFGLVSLIFIPLVVLLYLILARLWIETLANLQRIGDNTQKMAEKN
jgi:hypothetical protein